MKDRKMYMNRIRLKHIARTALFTALAVLILPPLPAQRHEAREKMLEAGIPDSDGEFYHISAENLERMFDEIDIEIERASREAAFLAATKALQEAAAEMEAIRKRSDLWKGAAITAAVLFAAGCAAAGGIIILAR